MAKGMPLNQWLSDGSVAVANEVVAN